MAIVYDVVTLTLSTLAGLDCISTPSKIDASRRSGFRIMKTQYWIGFDSKTGGEGPIMVGFSAIHEAAAIEEAIESDPQDAEDDTKGVQAMRPVWPLEMLGMGQTDDADGGGDLSGSFNPKWSVPEAEAAFWWAYNMDASALTTGCVVKIFAKHFGVWLRD